MSSNTEFLSVPKFDYSKAQDIADNFIHDLQIKFKVLKENLLHRLVIDNYILEDVNNLNRPINTKHGLLFTITNNSEDHRKLEIIIDEMNKVTLSFFYFKNKRDSTHHVFKCNTAEMPIDEIVEKFIQYRLLPNFNVIDYKSFNENEWSEESANFAKSAI